jgi:hypothetical protein
MMRSRIRSVVRSAATVAGAIALVTIAAASPVEASGRHRGHGHGDRHGARSHDCRHGHEHDWRHGHGDFDRRHHWRAPARSHATFVVPRHIPAAHHRTWAHYHRGRVYHAPHRHHHRVYVFPVRVAHGVEYRPHHYCGDTLLVPRPIGRGLRIELGF